MDLKQVLIWVYMICHAFHAHGMIHFVGSVQNNVVDLDSHLLFKLIQIKPEGNLELVKDIKVLVMLSL